jgi:hypothetical protein
MARRVDVVIAGGGSLYLFHLRSAASRRWVEQNVSKERQFLGNALAVEHRFASDLAEVMEIDGLRVSLAR